jgi:cytochrome c oxidase assembly factor CtaG
MIGSICSAAGRWGDWTFDLWITAPLAATALLHLAGTAVLWARCGVGRGVSPRQAALFWAGWLTLVIALVSPIHHYGEQLFTLHMIEHELVMAVAAPLLVLSWPMAALLWAWPRPIRLTTGRLLRSRLVRSIWRGLSRPLPATVLHGVAIWAWHVPVLFDAALIDVPLHRLQHVSFLATALLFWWALMRRAERGAACGHMFFTMLHTGALGALMAVAPRVIYGVQTAHAAAWGLSPLEDQQLAGLVMWIPAGTIYAAAAIMFAAQWVRRSSAAWAAGPMALED